MKDSTRRIVLLVAIAGVGSVMVLFDVPFLLLIAGVLALVLMVLVLSGSLKLSGIKLRGRNKEAPSGAPLPAAAVPAQKPAKAKPARQKVTLGGLASTMRKAFGALRHDLFRSRAPKLSREERQRQIDRMLDRSVKGDTSVLAGFSPEMVPSERAPVADPFKELISDVDSADTDLLDKMDFSVGGDDAGGLLGGLPPLEEMAAASGAPGKDEFAELDASMGSAPASITLDEEPDDEVASILAQNAAELEVMDMPGSTAPEDAEEIDFSTIDLDSELDVGKEPEKAAPAPAEAPASAPSAAAAAPAAAGPEIVDEKSMISFASATGEGDDLISSLKTDVKTGKKKENLSLLRNLKDVRVAANDLQSELESILGPK